MRKITTEQYKQIEKAYNEIKEHQANTPDTSLTANKLITSYHQAISDWDEETPISDLITEQFINTYLYGSDAETVAASGAGGKTTKQNFYTFMLNKQNQQLIKDLYMLRKRGPIHSLSFTEINPYINKLEDRLTDFPFENGDRPKILVRRFLIMTLLEIFTTIADEGHLKKTAVQLGLHNVNTYIFQHEQIRSLTNQFLEINDLLNKTDAFTQAAIAWYINI